VVRRGLSAEPHLRGSAAAFALDLRHACRPEPVRLPVPGVPDAVLGETGRGPRTELTHQVAGRRAHAAPAVEGRSARVRAGLARRRAETHPAALRRWAVSAAAVLVLTGALAGAAWVGADWGRQDAGRPVPAADSDQIPAGAPSARTSGGDAAVGVSDGPPAPAPPDAVVPEPVVPEPAPAAVADPAAGDLDGWAALVRQLYAQRARAYATADGGLLATVYAPGSALLQRDAEQVAELARGGQAVVGFDPTVLRVTSVTGDGGRLLVELVDEVPGHRVVPAGAPAGAPSQEVAGRGPAAVLMTLQRTVDGWRITEAEIRG
jgi:hypothetical protein